MDKYIKSINWPWVEIRDSYGSTIVININEVTSIWDKPGTMFKYGIRFKDGTWDERLGEGALTELKELVMTRDNKNEEILDSLDVNLNELYENQSLYEWLQENGQA